jgi:hypothetical protein
LRGWNRKIATGIRDYLLTQSLTYHYPFQVFFVPSINDIAGIPALRREGNHTKKEDKKKRNSLHRLPKVDTVAQQENLGMLKKFNSPIFCLRQTFRKKYL